MIISINKLKSGIEMMDFYKMLYYDKKFIEKVKDTTYNILVKYGKIARDNKESLSNKKNMVIDVDTSNNTLNVDFHWGKSSGEFFFFQKRIRDMTDGTSELPSIDELIDWVQGKKRFFAKNPFMLKNGASFYRDVGDGFGGELDDEAYAIMLADKMDSAGKWSFGDRVFRGQSKDAGEVNPIEPEYTRRNKPFIDAINEKINKLFYDRYKSISERLVDRILAHQKGDTEYVVIVDGSDVNIINTALLREDLVEYIRGAGELAIEVDEEMENDLIAFGENKSAQMIRVAEKLFAKINNMIRSDLSGGVKVNISKYEQAILNTIKRIGY